MRRSRGGATPRDEHDPRRLARRPRRRVARRCPGRRDAGAGRGRDRLPRRSPRRCAISAARGRWSAAPSSPAGSRSRRRSRRSAELSRAVARRRPTVATHRRHASDTKPAQTRDVRSASVTPGGPCAPLGGLGVRRGRSSCWPLGEYARRVNVELLRRAGCGGVLVDRRRAGDAHLARARARRATSGSSTRSTGPTAIERALTLGEPAGVLQLLDRHNRDCAALAARLGVSAPRRSDLVAGLAVGGRRGQALPPLAGDRSLVARAAGARRRRGDRDERVLHGRARGSRSAPAAPSLAAAPALDGLEPEHLLVGHGEGMHGAAATAPARRSGATAPGRGSRRRRSPLLADARRRRRSGVSSAIAADPRTELTRAGG